MIRSFHRGLALIVAFVYLYVVAHLAQVMPALQFLPAPFPRLGLRSGNPVTGWLVVFGLPLVTIICFSWPEQLMWRLSPRLPPSYEYLFTPGVWYLLGYVCLALSVGVSLLFR